MIKFAQTVTIVEYELSDEERMHKQYAARINLYMTKMYREEIKDQGFITEDVFGDIWEDEEVFETEQCGRFIVKTVK